LSSAGELRGLELETPRNFKILPYVVGSADRNFLPGATTKRDGDFGGDAKFGLTPSLNLDLTYNTDFAQVEVDTEQINLSRFNLRFPEKRPFFLENSGLFTMGKGNELDLFFSRRIGLDENGAIVPIIAGGRLTGKISGFNVGVLNMQTEDIRLVPANNFSVMRVSRELPNRSGLGAMFVNRSGTGSLSTSDDWNRTWGADGRLGVGEYFTMAGFAARTETPGLTVATTHTTSTPNTTTGRTALVGSTDAPERTSIPRLDFSRTRMAIAASTAGITSRCGSRRFATGDFASGSLTCNTRAGTTGMAV
jgi:hypothetical protein